MVLIILLGVVVTLALVVLGILFFMLSKEGKKEELTAVPLTDLDQLRKELSPGFLQPQIPKVSKIESEIIPPFEPKVTMPAQAPQAPREEEPYKKRAQELEIELRTISQKAEGQSQEAKQMIESLTKENDELKSQQAKLQEAKLKLEELQTEASSLKSDNVTLQSQLETTNSQVRLLEEQMAAFKIQMGEEIRRANETVSELTQEKEALIQAPKAEPDQVLRQEFESLKIETTLLKQKYEDLEKTHQKLNEFNTQLVEKTELLQYELVKARAQSSGLERISFNYKNQLEDFFKKVNAVQVTNDHLSQVKNRLEGMMEQVKLQNEELVKKDQLAQFELEKNRSRLVSLEREYEDLKVRVQQKDQQ